MAKSLCRVICTTGISSPLIVVVTEGGLAGITSDWGVDDVILDTAGPAEVEARLRLAVGRTVEAAVDEAARSAAGALVIDESTYCAPRGAAPRPDLQGVRAAEVPRPAPGPGLHPLPAPAGGLGLRLLRRHPHRRRARAPPARQARHRLRGAHRHRAQRRLPVRPPQVAESFSRARGLTWRAPSACSRSTTPPRRRCAGCGPARPRADGVGAVSEAFRLAVGPPGDGVVHLLRHADDDTLVGYAQVAEAGTADAVAELVVDPPSRRLGHGRALLDAALAEGARSVWAHGMLPAADALARAAGLEMTRSLHLMKRPLTAADAVDPQLPPGFSVRAFAPGRDDETWVRAQRGGLRTASGTGAVDGGRPARADGPAVVRPGRPDPRRRGRHR